MTNYRKPSHVVFKCDYQIVWVPKYKFRILKGAIKELVDHDIRILCEWKGCIDVRSQWFKVIFKHAPSAQVMDEGSIRLSGHLLVGTKVHWLRIPDLI